LHFQVACVTTVIYRSLMSLFTISFKAPSVKTNFQDGILKAAVFSQSPVDFNVEDITCYKPQIKLRITSFQDTKEILEGLPYRVHL